MDKSKKHIKTIDEYIAACPVSIRKSLEKLRQTILNAAPGAEEGISYQMPVFKQNGNLVYFGVFKNHIGFFPTSSGINAFKKELSGYKLSKGTVQFPFERPIPFELVKKILKYRVKENLEKKKKKVSKWEN